MSALAKPMIHSSRAIGDIQPINAEKVLNFVKIVLPPIPNSTKTLYKINFIMESWSAPKDNTWNYADQADMDADFTAILGLVSTVTP